MAIKYLDVRSFVQPDPFLTVVQELAELEENDTLRVRHHCRPFPLFDRLSDMGFAYACCPDGVEGFYIEIWICEDCFGNNHPG